MVQEQPLPTLRAGLLLVEVGFPQSLAALLGHFEGMMDFIVEYRLAPPEAAAAVLQTQVWAALVAMVQSDLAAAVVVAV